MPIQQSFKNFICGSFFLLSLNFGWSQFGDGGNGIDYTIVGENSVFQGTTEQYQLEPVISGVTVTWNTSNTSVASVESNTTNSAEIQFHNPGTVFIIAVIPNGFSNPIVVPYEITVRNGIPEPPSNPEVIVDSCGIPNLYWVGEPDQGVTWYWQGLDSNGTRTDLGSGNTFPAHETGTYYIRARHNASELWSIDSGLVPVTTSAPTLNGGSIAGNQNLCINGTTALLENAGSATNGDGNYEYQWEVSNNGTTDWLPINNATSSSYQPSDDISFSLSYRRAVRSCDQVAYSNTVQVNKEVVEIPEIDSIVNDCGSTTLRRDSPPSNTITWYWQSTANGIDESNSDEEITFTHGNTYYLRAKNDFGCWSESLTVEYTIEEGPEWYLDSDNDGLGDPSQKVVSCTQPAGHVSNADDECPNISSPDNICSSITSTNPADNNYIYSRTYQSNIREANKPDLFVVDDDVIQQISYVDGLGRPFQDIGLGQAPNRNDMVTQSRYDTFGRMSQEWLPTTMPIQEFGHVQDNVESAIANYYNTPKFENTQNPYSQKEFEPSPLNRITKQAAPGNDWAMGAGNEISFSYQVNAQEDQVKLFEVTTLRQGDTFIPTLVESNFYSQEELQKTITYKNSPIKVVK